MIQSELIPDSMNHKIEAASRDAARQAVERAARTRTHVLVYRDGQTLRLTAEQAQQELNQKLKTLR